MVLTALPLLLAGTPTSAATTGPLTLSTASGSAGQRVLLSGSGFTPGESVQPYWNYGTSSALAQKSFYLYNPIVTARSDGTAQSDLFVPTVPSGAGTISLVGLTSGVVDTASLHRRRTYRYWRGNRARRVHADVRRLGVRGTRGGQRRLVGDAGRTGLH